MPRVKRTEPFNQEEWNNISNSMRSKWRIRNPELLKNIVDDDVRIKIKGTQAMRIVSSIPFGDVSLAKSSLKAPLQSVVPFVAEEVKNDLDVAICFEKDVNRRLVKIFAKLAEENPDVDYSEARKTMLLTNARIAAVDSYGIKGKRDEVKGHYKNQ